MDTNILSREHSPSPSQQSTPSPGRLLTDFPLLLAFGFGSGLSPMIPGTIGTLMAVPLYLLLAALPLSGYLALVALSAGFGIWLCANASRKLGVHDHKGIVWDEFVGLWITMIAVPLNWQNLAAGFVLFRVFDMVKPWPICVIDNKVHGGFGIMLDDIVAGIAACGCLHILLYTGWL